MRRIAWLSMALVAAVVSLTARARAQVGFEGIVKDINDINFFFSCWHPSGAVERRGDCPLSKNGYGVEVSFEIGKWGIWRSPLDTTKAHWDSAGLKWKPRSPIPWEDSTISGNWHAQQVDAKRYVLVELALGYSQFSGFASPDASFELSGTVREIPAVAVYGTLVLDDAPRWIRWLSPYVGARSGLIQLNNTQILTSIPGDTVVTYNGSATAFQIGGVGGLVAGLFGDRLSLFIERAYNIRKFASVQWAAGGTPKIPRAFPRSLDFSGPTTTVGVQMTLREPK